MVRVMDLGRDLVTWIVEDRVGGLVVGEIARKHGVSEQLVRDVLDSVLSVAGEGVGEYLRRELMLDLLRLDRLWARVYESINSGSLGNVSVALKILELRAKWLGYGELAGEMFRGNREHVSDIVEVLAQVSLGELESGKGGGGDGS